MLLFSHHTSVVNMTDSRLCLQLRFSINWSCVIARGLDKSCQFNVISGGNWTKIFPEQPWNCLSLRWQLMSCSCSSVSLAPPFWLISVQVWRHSLVIIEFLFFPRILLRLVGSVRIPVSTLSAVGSVSRRGSRKWEECPFLTQLS